MFKSVSENMWIIWMVGGISFVSLGAVIVLSILGKTLPDGLLPLASTGLGGFIGLLKSVSDKKETTTTEPTA